MEVTASTEATTDSAVYREAFDRQRAHATRMSRTTAAERIARLEKLRETILERQDDLRAALYADFRKPPEEVDLTEIIPLFLEIRHAQRHVGRWMRSEKVPASLPLLGTSAEVRYEPKGVVLIIAPWNYPVLLTLGPLVSAIAAGNCAILKPSEYTPRTSATIQEIVTEAFDDSEVALFNGDQSVARSLLELPFNHIFFTGSPAVGRKVMVAAARHPSSVTLELGGKSPVIIDESADLASAALSIMWAKYANAGQTCIAPDFALVPARREEAFVAALAEAAAQLTANTDIHRESFSLIVSERHARRIRGLVEETVSGGAALRVGGLDSKDIRLIPPTVLTGVGWESPIMSEEIFGPVLPVIAYEARAEVIERLRAMPIPLSLYVFSADPEAADFWTDNTRSGGAVINDVAIHFANPDLPFGGMQTSGVGRSHGRAGFLAFSEERAVMRQRLPKPPIRQLYPPYGPLTRRLIDWLLRYAR